MNTAIWSVWKRRRTDANYHVRLTECRSADALSGKVTLPNSAEPKMQLSDDGHFQRNGQSAKLLPYPLQSHIRYPERAFMMNESNPYCSPAETSVAPVHELTVTQAKSGRRRIMRLAIAWGWWGWLLSDMWRDPIGDLSAFLIFTAGTLTAGVCGHLLYCYVLRWRGIVLLSLLLAPLPVLGLLGFLFGSVAGMLELLALPIEFVAHQTWTHRITFSLPVFSSIVLLAIAHPLKPGLSNAIITAIGISLWYGIAFLVGANAG